MHPESHEKRRKNNRDWLAQATVESDVSHKDICFKFGMHVNGIFGLVLSPQCF